MAPSATLRGAERPAYTPPVSSCPTPAAALDGQNHHGQTGLNSTCRLVLLWGHVLPRSGRATQSCEQLGADQPEEAGADVSSTFLPSSDCMENSSWTPSWASRQVAGTQPCSSNVLTNHQPEKKKAGSSAQGSHHPKNSLQTTSLGGFASP